VWIKHKRILPSDLYNKNKKKELYLEQSADAVISLCRSDYVTKPNQQKNTCQIGQNHFQSTGSEKVVADLLNLPDQLPNLGKIPKAGLLTTHW
jgi:hypothetical protein